MISLMTIICLCVIFKKHLFNHVSIISLIFILLVLPGAEEECENFFKRFKRHVQTECKLFKTHLFNNLILELLSLRDLFLDRYTYFHLYYC